MEPGSGKRRPVWTASGQKTGPKWVSKGLVEFSTISHGSTHQVHVAVNQAWKNAKRSQINRLILGWDLALGNECDDLQPLKEQSCIAAIVSGRSLEDP